MERVLQIINQMQADGVVESYAIGDGIAAVYYIEPYHTDDIDIFIPVSAVTSSDSTLLSLDPIYSYLTKLGYTAVKEGVLIEDWLVQFIPAGESTQEEALLHAHTVRYGDTETRIFSPEYLAAELLRSGRLKDYVRVEALIESGKMDMDVFHELVRRHGLNDSWRKFTNAAE
ncbi:MAG: hypothetical protein WAM70_14230 [Pyrinomonadaceae bacterium]